MRSELIHALALAAAVTGCGRSPSLQGQGLAPADLAMTPAVGYGAVPIPVIITGTGFLVKVTQPAGGGPPIRDTRHRAWLGTVELDDVTWQSATVLDATIPAGIAPGVYALTVENALGSRGSTPGAYTALAAPPFSATAAFDRATADVGQQIVLDVVVTNQGGGAIDALAAGVPTVSSSDGGALRLASRPPAVPASLAAGGTVDLAWTYAPTAPGGVSVTVVIQGVDRATGDHVTAALAAPATARIQTPAALSARWSDPPSAQTVGVPVTLILVLSNAEGAADALLTGLAPRSEPAAGMSCGAVDPAPSPTVPVSVSGGADQAFTWSCTASTFGRYLLGADIEAADANTGAALGVAPTGVAVDYTTPLLLTVVPAGDGAGTVGSLPSGIAGCGGAGGICAASFLSGTTVTLTAAPAEGSTVAWSGCTTAAGVECAVRMDGARSVTATFTLRRESLTVSVSSGGGVTCGGVPCAATYPYGAVVALTATPDATHAFDRWTGDCAAEATPTCTLTMTGPRSARATFTRVGRP